MHFQFKPALDAIDPLRRVLPSTVKQVLQSIVEQVLVSKLITGFILCRLLQEAASSFITFPRGWNWKRYPLLQEEASFFITFERTLRCTRSCRRLI